MKTTFSRTFYPAAIILLVALLLVGTSFQILVKNYLNEKTLEGLKTDGNAIAQLASAYYSQDSMSSQAFFVNLSMIGQISGADAVICDRDGRLVLCSDSPLGCRHQGMVLDDQEFLTSVFTKGVVSSVGQIQSLYTESRYVVAVPILHATLGAPIGIVIVSTPIQDTLSVLERLGKIYLTVSLLVVLVAMVVISVLARRLSTPLRIMATTANRFGHGQLDARVRVAERSPQEVQDLAIAFNNMASSLQKSEQQRQDFIANVSHELKTPMITIGGYIDGMLDGTIPQESYPKYMSLVSDETKRLSRLVRSMLDISRLQDQERIHEDQKSRFDICECAGRVLITFEQKITAKQLQVEVDMPEHPVFTHASLDYITQVVYNLVDNAVKFCPEEGRLTLQVQETDRKIYVSVGNDGQTIPSNELPLVFDRFHKLDRSRSEHREGWGLGLYIVKTIICSNGEDICVSSKDGYTQFTFTLPLVN